MSDFDSEPIEETMSNFIELYDLKNLVRVPALYKNNENCSCIDIILAKKNICFQDSFCLSLDFLKIMLEIRLRSS